LEAILTNLLALQAVDDEVRQFQVERDELHDKIMRLKELLTLMTTALNEKRAKLDEATRWYREKDAELKVDNEKVKRAKTKLQTVTKNREFMAMQREIETLRKANLSKEEEIMKLVQAIDEFKASIATEEEKIAALQSEVSEEEKSNANRLAELEEKISSIADRRSVILEKLQPRIITLYERIAKARRGTAIAPISRQGTCFGCNQRLTPRQLQLVLRGETLEQCPSCTRIVYKAKEPPSETTEDNADVNVADAI